MRRMDNGMRTPTPEQRAAIHWGTLFLNEFRKVYADIGAAHCLTLLAVASEPGLTVTELARKTGTSLASMSRHVELLGPYLPGKDVGLGVLQNDTHPTDRRRRVITLTEKGWRIVESIAHLHQTK